MGTRSGSISRAQVIAYESASHELARLLDDAAALLCGVYGEESVLGRLAEETRWAAFLLYDRIASHAVRHSGVPQDHLAIRALTPEDLLSRAPNRFRAASSSRTWLDVEVQRTLSAALSTTKAVIAGMSGGYARAHVSSHPIMTALRSAAEAVDALQAELARDQRGDHDGGGRSRAPAARPPRISGECRSQRMLLLLRTHEGARGRSRAPTRRRTLAGP